MLEILVNGSTGVVVFLTVVLLGSIALIEVFDA